MSALLNRIFIIVILCYPVLVTAQTNLIVDSTRPDLWKVIAGPEYRAGRLHTWLWGEDYRKEWTTPVMVPVLNLDTAFGGLTPVKEGGGRQTKSLRLKDASGRHYVLRSVNKTYTGALPEIIRGTFLETIANDQIATNHPYAALSIPGMAEAAHIYHTNPRYYIVPYSQRLGKFNETFANTLCLLEERPDETQVGLPSFGFPEDIVSTEDMMEKMKEENDHKMDQPAYLKTRLFDIFAGDWGRHKDNWRWARFDSGTLKIYRPVPKDRDQTYARFEGLLLSLIVSGAGLKQLQTFDNDIRNIEWYNYPALEIDRRFTNQLTEKLWIDSAKALQAYLTDEVIEASVNKMPEGIPRKEIISKLKSRRSNLVSDAKKYYEFLTKEVEIAGSKQNEIFEVSRLNDDETRVSVYLVNKEGKTHNVPVYNRIFSGKETKEIRLYGIGGNDIFRLRGTVRDGILVRIIGGTDRDSLDDQSKVAGGSHKTKYYDNPGNDISSSGETKIYTSTDTAINRYKPEDRKYDSKGLKKAAGYQQFYRFYVGLGYGATKHKWRKEPYAFEHRIGINYSITENTFNPYYKASFQQLLGNWNLNLGAGYDAARRVNYFGIGNETLNPEAGNQYNWLRTHNFYGSFGIDQLFREHHRINLDFFYDGIQVIDHEGRFVSKASRDLDPAVFDWKHFAGSRLGYSFIHVNDPIVPSKGINFNALASYTKNIRETSQHYTNLSTNLSFYLPLFKPFSLAIKTGAATLSGQPEFYQMNNIGGYYTLRGYPRYRFYGKSIFYNQNELRWMPAVKSYVFNGKIGLLALYDQGRVWQPGETSSKWHHGIGGGLILVPFNKVSATVTYTISEEKRMFNLHFGKFF